MAVDDKRANLLALEAVLADEHNVIFADSGPSAIALLEQRHDIDVILMDVQMPGMDGFETAARIQAVEAHREIPIIFVTAEYKEDPHVKRGYEVGGIDYFSKPFDPDILRKKVGVYASFKRRDHLLRERERSIRDSEELLRVGRTLSTLLESLPVGVLIADADGVICQCTAAVSSILKADRAAEADAYGEIIGWWDTSGKLLKEGSGPLIRALRTGQASHNERLDIRCCDGSEKTILASASPLCLLDGRIAGAVVLIQDVTEKKKIERELEDRVTRLIGGELEAEHHRNDSL